MLLGDAAHTAHFSIGSGTKLAMEDALALAACLHEQPDVDDGAGRATRPSAGRSWSSTQRAAQASLEWFENLGQYVHQQPCSSRSTCSPAAAGSPYDNLRLRDPEFAAAVDALVRRHGRAGAGRPRTPPMFHPFRLRGLNLRNRVVVSPMDMYSAADGVPGDFHLVHLGGKALGGAGLVMTEMVCVSPTGRITPGCAGLYTDEQEAAWRRIVDFVHAQSGAAIGLQLGHSGRKGSTRLMWEGIDEPLPEGNWQVCRPVPAAVLAGATRCPRELTRADLDAIRDQFVPRPRRGARGPASTCSNCTARTATCSRRSSRR